MVSKHVKPNPMNQQGGIIKKENYIHVSNVMYLHDGKPTRLGAMIIGFCPEIMVKSFTAPSNTFALSFASPTPILIIIFSIFGTANLFL